MDRRHRVTVSRESLETFAGPHVPDTDTLVKTAGDHQVGLRVEITTKCIVRVSLQSLQTLPTGQLPDLQGLVVTGGDQQPGV